MPAVFRKELRLAYGSLFGYAVAAILLFFMGLFTAVLHLMSRYADFSVSLASMQAVLAVLVPLAALRAFAAETRNGTDRWLFSLPVSTGAIVTGKFFALLTVFALPTALTALYPTLLSSFGRISLAAAYSSLFGYFLLIAALIALSLFCSALVRGRIASALLSLGVCLAVYFSDLLTSVLPSAAGFSMVLCLVASFGVGALLGLLSRRVSVGLVAGAIPAAVTLFVFFLAPSAFVSLVPRFLSAANPFARMSGFSGGYFDLNALLYFLGFSALLLLGAKLVLDSRRLQGGAR